MESKLAIASKILNASLFSQQIDLCMQMVESAIEHAKVPTAYKSKRAQRYTRSFRKSVNPPLQFVKKVSLACKICARMFC